MITHPDLLVGNNTGDDAAVYRVNDETALILTVDFFTPITDDPYDFGLIAAANSLSDVLCHGRQASRGTERGGFPPPTWRRTSWATFCKEATPRRRRPAASS